jgi:branched-chain amino acid transport system substrate-binding protein
MKAVRRLSLGVAVALLISMLGSGGVSAGEPARGEPVVIGIYTPEDNPLFTAPELVDGAEAAVKYVNRELDGLGGRPLQLESCKSDFTAPGLTACANELFQKDPLMIIPGPDSSALTVFPIFVDSGIPLIGGASFTPPEYSAPNRAVFNGFSASLFPGMVHFAVNELKANRLTAISFDEPSNVAIKGVFMDPVAEAKGLPRPAFQAAPVGSADLTPTFAAALEADPDALLVFGLPCAPVFQAYESLGTDVPIVLPSNCSDAETLEDAGTQAEGAYFVELFKRREVSPNDKDVKLYQQKIKKYGKGITDTDFARAGFGTIMNIHALLDDTDVNTLTRESVLTAFKTAADQPNFLNTPYDCASPPVPQYPGICSGSAYLVRVKDGKVDRETRFVTLDRLFEGAGGQ